MRSQDFLAAVLPSTGNYCAVEISTAKKEHKWVSTVDELYTAAMTFSEKGYNAYFALASFNENNKRLADNATHMRSLFIDIDCGEGKDYPDKQAAGAALDTFLSESRLAELGTPYIVSSGGGLHVYFPLEADVEIASWKPVAENLKRLAKKLKFNIDFAVTGDAARVLRVPDTKNYKFEKPRTVKVLVEGAVFKLDQVASLLLEQLGSSSYEPTVAKLDIAGEKPAAAPTANSVKLLENSVTVFTNIETKCEQVKFYINNAQDDGMEPLWRGILSLAKHCQDGDEAAKRITDMHPYDHDRMYQKIREIKGPYSCVKMDEVNPGICEGCPHYGKHTNALALGRVIATHTDSAELVVEKQISEHHVEKIAIVRPTPPRGFQYGAKGGIFMDKDVKDDDGKMVSKSVMVLPYDLFAVDILNKGGDHLVHMMAFRPEGTVDVLIPQKSVVSKDETVKALANQNIIAAFGSGNDKNLYEYVRGCVEHASANKVAVRIPDSCGWQSDNTFVYNSKVFYADGREIYVPTPDLDNVNQATAPTGTMENWQKVFKMLVAKELWEILAMALVGPASILMKFSGFRGCVYHLGSSDTGTGKSLALELAASFWGHPELYRVSQSTSAVASQQRQGILGSLPLITDEITAKSRKDFEWLPEFLLDLTQGKGKDRMEQGANRERLNKSVWNLLVLFSSNTHIFDYLSGQRKHASQAEMVRVLELTLNKKLKWTEEESAILDLLKNNYGVVGYNLIKWIVANRETAKEVFEKTRTALKQEMGVNDDERYWTAGNSCIVAMAILLSSKYANIIDIPVQPIVDVLKQMTEKARGIVYGSKRTAEDILNAYTREFYGKFVVVKAVNGVYEASLGENGVIDASLTRSDIAGRVEHGITPGHVDYYIEVQLLKAHCVSMSFGFSDFKEQIEKNPYYKVKPVKKDMLSKTRGPSMRVNALQITRPIGADEQED